MSWFEKKKVVVPIDFSDESVKAVDTALEIVDSPTHLRVIHVGAVLTATEPGMMWDTVNDETRKEHLEEAFAKRFQGDKYAGIEFTVRFGDAGHEIAEFAEEEGADLLVMPSHGRTGLKRLLIGSVAERVVRLAHCPVLVLRD